MDKHDELAEVEFESNDDQSAKHTETPPPGRRLWIEVLVDPKTLQGLMFCGGGLLVLGLVVWLWSIGIFENKLVVATCLGVANAALLVCGVAGARFSRYQTASKAVTMLACLVMPLNLWFYDAQGLITLDQGGHLWVPALVCCAIYVVVARILADPLFVNAIVGGVTMTGLLFLADNQIGRLWEIIAPSSFLVVLGMICIHVERAFPPEDGPFSRANFGRAFFRAGHIVMGLGLMVLLVGRIAGRLYEPWLSQWDWLAMPAVATQANLKLLAMALALGGAYSYIYSQVVVQAKGRYVTSAVLTLIWSAIILLDLLQVAFTMELVMLLTAIGGLLTSGARVSTKPMATVEGNPSRLGALVEPLWQTSAGLANTLNLATLGLGLALYSRARFELVHAWTPYEFGGIFVIATLVGGIACWLAGRSESRGETAVFGLCLRQASVVLAWLAVDASFACLGFELTAWMLVAEMSVPLVLAIVALQASHETARRQWALVSEALATVLLVVGTAATLGFARNEELVQSHQEFSAFFIIAAIGLGLASRASSRIMPAILAAISICASTWQLFLLLGVTQYVFVLATTFIGVVCLAASFFIRQTTETPTQFAIVSQWTGRICLSYSSAAAILIALARLLTGETDGPLLGILVAQVCAAGFVGLLAKDAVWRRHFWVLATANVVMTLLVINALSTLSLWQRGEVLLTIAGLVMLVTGFWGWYRERDREEDWVSFNLAMGSLLSAGPLALGMLVQRFDDQLASWGWMMVHEAGVLGVGLLLLGAGVLCRIRWSTIVGGSTLLIYVVSLIALIRLPNQLQSTAVYMMIGGGLFFGAAVLLSVYRDRLLDIPKRVQSGEGVFRVLKWR